MVSSAEETCQHDSFTKATLLIYQEGDEFLPMLQKEILDVIRKYVPVDQQAVRIELDQEGDYEVLELNITLPDRSSRN